MEYRIENAAGKTRIVTTKSAITVYVHAVAFHSEALGETIYKPQGTKVGEYDRGEGWTVREIKQRYEEMA